ncbi:MAG: methionyl-tRNA formyltransferase [Proteobacteria bacterium]|nr:methionyl-tRNA formyltransferase [Pseudomonadota bacterium]
MRVIFMGSPDFAVPILSALRDKCEIVAVYCQPPRRAGRGQTQRPCAVQQAAESAGLEVRTVDEFKEDACKDFSALKADLAIVVAYGLILPTKVLDAPRLGCVNIHASLLPRWRGAAPIHRAIMAGDKTTGVCLMQMNAGLDEGAVLACEKVAIDTEDTTASLAGKLCDIGAGLIVKALPDIETLQSGAVAQSGDITYAKKIIKSETEINWQATATEVRNHIHGLSPFPGAWFWCKGERVKVLSARVLVNRVGTDRIETAGTVLDSKSDLTVACGAGALNLLKLQRAGKTPMDVKTFLRGFPIAQGDNVSD